METQHLDLYPRSHHLLSMPTCFGWCVLSPRNLRLFLHTVHISVQDLQIEWSACCVWEGDLVDGCHTFEPEGRQSDDPKSSIAISGSREQLPVARSHDNENCNIQLSTLVPYAVEQFCSCDSRQ